MFIWSYVRVALLCEEAARVVYNVGLDVIILVALVCVSMLQALLFLLICECAYVCGREYRHIAVVMMCIGVFCIFLMLPFFHVCMYVCIIFYFVAVAEQIILFYFTRNDESLPLVFPLRTWICVCV